MIEVYAVWKLEPGKMPAFHSAWGDLYDAKHEAARWEEALKITHQVLRSSLGPYWQPTVMVQTEEGPERIVPNKDESTIWEEFLR